MDPAARRLLILLTVLLLVASAVGVLRIFLDMEISGSVTLLWVYGTIVVDAAILVGLVVYTRRRELGLSDLEQRLASRTTAQGSSRGGWMLAVFDNGLVMQGQRQGAVVSFYLCYGPDLRRYAPSLAEIRTYMRGFGVMRRVDTISKRKGDPAARATLEQLRGQLGARWVLLALLRRRPDKRSTVKAPQWVVGITCYWPRWSRGPDALLNGVNPIEATLESAQRDHSASTMAAG